MSAGVCGAQAPLLGAEAHRSRHAENEGKRKESGEGNGAQVCISAGDRRSWGKAQFKLLLEYKGLDNFTV